MHIQSIETYRLKVPLRTPFKTALRTVEQVDDLVVKLTLADGTVGFGEAAPTLVITGDSLYSMHAVIHQVFKPLLLGRSLQDFNVLLTQLQQAVVGNCSAKAAMEIALYDARARSLGLPLYQLLGGGVSELETDITISVNSCEQMVADAKAAVARGYRALKVKIGTDPILDVARVQAIAAALPPHIQLRLDANQGWTAKQTIAVMRQLEASGIQAQLLEQPVVAADVVGLTQISHQIQTPVLADEAVFDVTQALQILQNRSADFINIKLMKTAGISQALQIAQLAKSFRIPCMMGCMLESAISVAAAAHVASACGIQLIDLDGPELCSYDPVAKAAQMQAAIDPESQPNEQASRLRSYTEFAGPAIRLNQSPGLGIEEVAGAQPWPWQP